MNRQFWKGKKVLVTGHTGFKGSWLSLFLQKVGANVIGFSKSFVTKPSLFELAHVDQEMTSIMGDIRDYKCLEEVVREYKPEIVFHMAAQSILRESYQNPVETYETNIMGTVNLLESIRQGGVKVIINVTSDKCYAINDFSHSNKEDDPMGGYDPYSSSKGCAELVTSAYRNSFFNPSKYEEHGVSLASCRSGNVIGGGDWAVDRLIPDIMGGILNNTKIIIRYPESIRPWQHVLDPLSGYMMLAEKLWHEGPKYSEGWNFGPSDDEQKTVRWIVDTLVSKWESNTKCVIDTSENPHEENYLKLDSTKANLRLNWKIKLNLDMALEWIIEWYKQYDKKNDMRKFTEKQIDEFLLL